MSIFIFLFCFITLQIGCCIVSRRSSGKDVSSGKSFGEDYFFSGRSLTFFPLAMTFIATQIGGGILLGTADASFQYGLSSFLYPLGVSLGLIILGCGPGKKLATSGMSTIPQIFQRVYASKRLKRLASLLSIVSLFMILTAQIVASDKFFSGIGLNGKWFLFVFWIVVLGYTTLGGFRAVVRTDILQSAFLIGSVLLCMGVILFFPNPDCNTVVASITTTIPYKKLWGWLLMPLLFMFIEQDMGQRCFAAKSPEILKRAAITAGLVTLFFNLAPFIIGILAVRRGLSIVSGQSVLMVAITALTNPWTAGIMACAVPVAIMSTADSLLNSVCSLINEEFIPEKFSSKGLWFLLTPVIAVSAILTAYCFNDVVEVLILSYGLSVTSLAVPILVALFLPGNYSTASAYCSVFFGGGTFLILKIFPNNFLPGEIVGLGASIIGFFFCKIIKRKSIVLPE